MKLATRAFCPAKAGFRVRRQEAATPVAMRCGARGETKSQDPMRRNTSWLRSNPPRRRRVRGRAGNSPAPKASGWPRARCTCGEAVRFPDERSEEPCEARSQEGAPEPRSISADRRSLPKAVAGAVPQGPERKQTSHIYKGRKGHKRRKGREQSGASIISLKTKAAITIAAFQLRRLG